jgi:aryl sulfotransferase
MVAQNRLFLLRITFSGADRKHSLRRSTRRRRLLEARLEFIGTFAVVMILMCLSVQTHQSAKAVRHARAIEHNNSKGIIVTTLPKKSAFYHGSITDSDRWGDFKHRKDDIFVCTPPKCGTTWTQAICAMLIFGSADHGQKPGVISPWLDATFAPIDEILQQIDAQKHRRFFKTHTPLDGIPYFESSTYLVVFRDPLDVYFSGLNHRDNMSDQDIARTAFVSGPDPYSNWLNGVRDPENWDMQSLETLTHFFRTFWPHRDLPNVHIYHYSDMKRDLSGTIKSMAAALGASVSREFLVEMTRAASFDSMKRNADQFAPDSGSGIWKAESNFFARGSNQQWKEKLSEDEIEAFDSRLAGLLPADEAEWLVNGTA